MRAHADAAVDLAAARLDAAQTSATAVVAGEDWPDLSLDQAYAVQREILERRVERGERQVGLKLGFTSEAKMRQMGVDELIVGRLTDAMLVRPDEVLDLSTLVHPRVEPEIAFLIGADVDLTQPDADLASAVVGVCAAMEVIDSRYEGFRFDLPRVVADNTSAAGFALGHWIDPDRVDLADLQVILTLDDGERRVGSTSAILGHPLRTLERLAILARRWDLQLPAGSVVLAGAATEAVPLTAGRTTVEVSTLGDVRIVAEESDR